MNWKVLVFVLFGTIGFVVTSPATHPPLPTHPPPVITTQENFYKTSYEKNKVSVVFIRTEIDPSLTPLTQKVHLGPSKNFNVLIYKESLVLEDSLFVQNFSMGTGFFISHDGEILTNYHVVDQHKTITVLLADGRSFMASVIGYQVDGDIALLKVQTDKPTVFTPLLLGDSSALRVSKYVMTIGHPFSLPWSLSLGIVSGINRQLPIHSTPLIQIQSAVNPGNSGGPLIASDDTVVGIIHSIPANGNGIGFAIPINYIKKLLPAIRGKQGEKTSSQL